ncbi:MAG TPA: hypothetical protein VFZ63_17040 [Jiangellaceae bacterium]
MGTTVLSEGGPLLGAGLVATSAVLVVVLAMVERRVPENICCH